MTTSALCSLKILNRDPYDGLTLALSMTHGDAVRMAASAAADARNPADTLRKQRGSGQALHTAHAGPDTGVQLVDAQRVQ